MDKVELDENETYQKIEGYIHYYITSNGRVYSTYHKGSWLKIKTTKKGYRTVVLSVNNRRTTYKVHQLVAKYFLDEHDEHQEHYELEHIDGDKSNNRADNLHYISKPPYANSKKPKQTRINLNDCKI